MGEFDYDIEVNLSGGGFRAAAFDLGALLYLVESGLNRKVVFISSVSGGSITNASVAQECDFVKIGLEEFKVRAAAPLGACLSNHSVGLLIRLKVTGEVCQFRGHGEDLPFLSS